MIDCKYSDVSKRRMDFQTATTFYSTLQGAGAGDGRRRGWGGEELRALRAAPPSSRPASLVRAMRAGRHLLRPDVPVCFSIPAYFSKFNPFSMLETVCSVNGLIFNA